MSTIPPITIEKEHMQPQEAINALNRMQSQIIHGTSVFGEIAGLIKGLEDELAAERAEKARVCPGAKARHCIITPACRTNRSDDGAFAEAVVQLRREYLAILDNRKDPINFHLVLTVESMA